VNRTGRFLLSHTTLRDRFTLRVALGNLRATERHVDECWALLRESAADV
jgi:aromatic-L-amino-acid decarboxylase